MSGRAIVCFIAVLGCALAVAQNTGELTTHSPPPVPQSVFPPSMSVPALTLPQSVPDGAGPEGTQPPQTPTFEITAVEAMPSGLAGSPDDRLQPFNSMLKKLSPDGVFQVVSQEAKEAPFSAETQWTINERYEAFVLPMEETKDGAVRLDARVVQRDGNKSLNALRAEGEVPGGKVMAFRGLQGPGGGELFLLLRQKSDDSDNKSKGDGDSENKDDMKSDSDQQGEDEQKDSDKTEAEEKQQGAEEGESAGDTPKDAENLEALLQSLEEEDQRQQADARFDRRKIELPSSGEWW